MSEKKLFRKRMLAQRRSLYTETAVAEAMRAQAGLIRSALWQNAHSVGLYFAINDEMPTSALLRDAMQNGKIVYLPKVVDIQKGKMVFLGVEDEKNLLAGPFGIPEPNGGNVASRCDLLTLPGLAFDLRGYRLGYGGGFYDRFLHSNPAFAKIKTGLCFSFQIVENVPHDLHDQRVDAICSEKGLIWL